MLQTPHRSQPRAPRRLQDLCAGPIGAKKLTQHSPSTGTSAKNSPSKRKNADFGVFCACRANFFAHKARQRGDLETDNTTARPQQGTAETDNTSAPENCAKNAHFSPAKAMAVSVEARSPPAKATGVSDNRPSWPTGPVCGAHGRRRGLARRPVGGQCYKRRQTNAIPITSREPL